MPANDTNKDIDNAASQERTTRVIRYAVSELMQGGREAILEHNGADYHLRITSNGRLILTK